MNQTGHAANRVHEINRTAVCDVDAQPDATLICDESITAREGFVALLRRDHGNFPTVNLFSGDKGRVPSSNLRTDRAVHFIKPSQRLGFVLSDIDARDARGETVHDSFKLRQGRKLFGRQVGMGNRPCAEISRIQRAGRRLPA